MPPCSTGRRRTAGAALAVLVATTALTACTPSPPPAEGTALAVLDTLPVKGRAARTGYARDRFGSGWVDTDHNGCDTRDDVLDRDLTRVVLDRDGCLVLRGTLDDPYTGRTITFRRGPDSSAVQIDHVVALSDAWQKGAQRWTDEQRVAFANDRLELLAVDGTTNQSKGDGDAATWLPPNTAFRCAYVARQVALKARYGLWVTSAERDAVARVLGGCPDERVPTDDEVPSASGGSRPSGSSSGSSGSSTSAPSTPAPSSSPAGAVPYANCAQAWDALGRPVRRSDPGYSGRLDRDGDGTGCETDPR